MKDDQRNYILVGVFVIAMLVGLVWWIAKLSGPTGPMDSYHIRYDAVPGLLNGAKVHFNGYPIGSIEVIEPVKGHEKLFRLEVTVKQGWNIPVDSEAKIVAGFLSAVFINIDGGDTTTYLEPGARSRASRPRT